MSDGDQRPYKVTTDDTDFYFDSRTHALTCYNVDSQVSHNNGYVAVYKWIPASTFWNTPGVWFKLKDNL